MSFMFGKDDERRNPEWWEHHNLDEIEVKDSNDSIYKELADQLNILKATGLSKEAFYELIDKLYDEVNRDSIANEMPDDSLDYVFDNMWTGWWSPEESFRKGGGKPFTIERGRIVEYPGTEEEYFNKYLDSVAKHPEKVDKRGMAIGVGQIHKDDFDRAQRYINWRKSKRRIK